MSEALTLYVVPASHPCVAVMKALELKGLEYKRVDLMFGLSNAVQMARFRARTVPGLTIGSRRVSGSRAIMRALEEHAPSLRVDDPAVAAAEEWGDLVLQEHARWIALRAVGRSPDAFESFAEGYKVPKLPRWSLGATPWLVKLEAKLVGHDKDYLPELEGDLDKVDAWLAEGLLGGEAPNAADLQILSSVRLLMNLADLEPAIASRPCGVAALARFPDYPGHVPAGVLAVPGL